jgi:uracil-DNA glycosylase family 4
MSDLHRALDLTVQYLESLKAGGHRYVSIAPTTLTDLTANRVQPQTNQRTASDVDPVPLEPVSIASPASVEPTPMPLTDSGAALSPEAKVQAIAELRERALVCVKCPNLVKSRRNVVFGVGSIDAELMFVGEAPGADEDVQGEPFVGAAGQLLTKMIQAMGLSRQVVYIANILKCRPDTPGQSYGNRKPTPEEMKTCIPYLHAQIDLIKPKVLVALGGTAVEGLLGANGGIMKMRGRWQTYRGIPLMPTFHPSYLLRNQALTERRRVWEDMLQVMERLSLPISDAQRRYFSKA